MSGRRLVTAGLLLGALTSAGAARADDVASTKAACVAQLDRAQALQSARKLEGARAEYLACTADACPELVREDCTRSLVELDRSLPTLVFAAREGGRDLVDVRVLLDGRAVASALDGHAVPVDPGLHSARFERPGGGTVEIGIVAREGEKNRAVSASFPAPLAPSPAPVKPRTESGRFPTLPVVLGGAGLLALGGSFYLRLDANADAARLHETCAPACDSSARDSLGDKLVVANVALGVGLGALALAAATWLFDPRR
ncbi:MAG: hypothetical protein JWP97_1744 [Labilithrix sp.]|nr:hypothetical protein [Labilithrix sp.]